MVHHNLNIYPAYSEAVSGSLSMKGMKFPLQVIITSLTLYYLKTPSTKALSQFLIRTFNSKVSHVTLANCNHKFAPYFNLNVDK